MTDSMSKGSLKRLDFVRSYSDAAMTKANDLGSVGYSKTKQLLPANLQAQFEKLVTKLSSTASPMLAKVTDTSGQVLSVVDHQMDGLIVTASRIYDNGAEELKTHVDRQRQFHEKNMEHYKSAREAYLRKIEETVEFLKKEGLSGTAKAAADTVMARVEDAKKIPGYLNETSKAMFDRVSSAWDKLQDIPAVKKLLNVVEPRIDAAYKQYLGAHDAVAGSPMYHKAVENSQGLYTRVKQMPITQKAGERVWPYISPYADPVIEKVESSSYYKAAVNHLKPIAANGM